MRDFIDAGIIKTIDSLAWGTVEILYPNHKRHLNQNLCKKAFELKFSGKKVYYAFFQYYW